MLNEKPHALSPLQRAARALLIRFLAIPDAYYRRVFARLDRAIIDNIAAIDGIAPGDRRGITMMIGSLNAGGAERQVMITLRGLVARGHRSVALVCLHLNTPAHRFFLPAVEAAGIPVTSLGSDPVDAVARPIARMIKALPWALHQVLDYAATLTETRPQVAHFWLDETNIMAGIAAVLTGVPRIVLSQRSLPPLNYVFHKSYMRESYRWLARHPAVIMVNNSQAGATAYEQWLGLPAGTIRVIRNGFEFPDELLKRYRDGRGNYRAQLGIPADGPLIGGVLRFSEEKRPLLWLDIAAQVRRHLPEARFLLIGDGVLRAKVIERANRKDLTGAIYLPGVEREPLAAMADMDLLLLTSRAEGLPNVLVEAQAVGTPVVTTNVGGAPETVQHGRTGWVLADDVAEHAALKIVELLRDRAWREKARQEAPEFVQETFGLDRAINETIALYLTHPAAKIEKRR